jgi:hypothetical protein
MRTDAPRLRCFVLSAGPNWHASDGCRHDPQSNSRPKGYADTALSLIGVGSTLIGEYLTWRTKGVGRGHWTKVQ